MLSELQIQGLIYTTLWSEFPEYRRCLFHVPNESAYDNGQQASSGVIPGTPDLFLVCFGNVIPIELKDDKGRVSRAQKVIHSLYAKHGVKTWLFYTAEEAIHVFREILSGLPLAIAVVRYSKYLSPYADGARYEEYLADYMKHRQEERKKRSETSRYNNQRRYVKK